MEGQKWDQAPIDGASQCEPLIGILKSGTKEQGRTLHIEFIFFPTGTVLMRHIQILIGIPNTDHETF